MNGTPRSGLPSGPNEPAWNATHMLDVHILDYLKKRNLPETAALFKHECKVSDKPCAIEAPSGFLFEWWSIFWDIYISRTNPSFSECASTYSEAQRAKVPIRQQQLQQQVQQQQHQMLQQQLMRDRDLRPDEAAQYAQQIMAGRIRISELGAVSSAANQEHMGAAVKAQMDEIGRTPPAGGLPSPSLERRASALDLQQRQQLLAAFQASKRSANQANLGPGQPLEHLRSTTRQTFVGGCSPSLSHPNTQANNHPGCAQTLMQQDALQPSPASAMLLPNSGPPELTREQAIQKLQLQYLHHQQQQQQQGVDEGAVHRGMSAGLSGPGLSRQSSGTMQQRYSQSAIVPAQQQQSQQSGLTPQQMMLLHHMQQHTGESMGGQVQVQVPEAEVQRRLLAQISSRGVLKPGHRFESSSLGNTLSDTGTAASFGIQNPLRTQQQQQQQQQQMVAELCAHHQQQQAQQAQQQQQHEARADSQLGMLLNSQLNSQAKLEAGVGLHTTPNIVELERRMPSCDSGQHRNSPANSTAAGSTLQTGRATPAPINSGMRNTTRSHGARSHAAKPANGTSNKKRKHSASTSPSNSASQETPSSNASGGSASHKGSMKQVPSSSAVQHSMDQVSWGHTHMGSASLLNSAGSGMNAAAAALDSSSVHILQDLMGDDGLLDSNLDPLLTLGGEGDPTDASFLSG